MAFSQNDFRPGFIVPETGDTLWGLLNNKDDLVLHEQCEFQLSPEAIIEKYNPNGLQSFGLTDQKIFVTRPWEQQMLFFKLLVRGAVNLYVWKDVNRHRFFLENQQLGFNEIIYEEEVITKDKEEYIQVSAKYKGLLNAYLGNDNRLEDLIRNINKPTESKLISLVRKYHEVNELELEYPQKRRSKNRSALEIQVGTIHYQKVDNLDESRGFVLGLIGHIGMARINEKLFLKTGVIFTTIDYPEKDRAAIKIPLQLEYRYPKGQFRPRLAYGISLYSPFASSASLSGGLDIVLKEKKVAAVLNYDLDFNSNGSFPLIPNGKLSDLFSVGLQLWIGK